MSMRARATLNGPSIEAVPTATRREQFLAEMERAVPWGELREEIERLFDIPGGLRSRPLELDRLLRVYFLQIWFRLSDVGVREELCDSNAMRGFACVGLGRGTVPTESAIAWFRRSLDECGIRGYLLEVANRHLAERGLAVAAGVIVDATLIDARTVGRAAGVPERALA